MDRRRVQTLHVVEREGRVDEEPEQAGADGVPEGNSDEEADRPAIPASERRGAFEAQGVERLEADQRERNHFERAEGGAHARAPVSACPLK